MEKKYKDSRKFYVMSESQVSYVDSLSVTVLMDDYADYDNPYLGVAAMAFSILQKQGILLCNNRESYSAIPGNYIVQ